jgi:AmmeMemoRadiSam system protein A
MEMNREFSRKDNLLTIKEKRELLWVAREAVKAAIAREIYVPSKPADSNLTTKAGAFVTLKEKEELRGCIGLIEARYPLYQVVAEMAEKSAMCDPRFESVRADEFENLQIEISVLSPLRKIHDPKEIEVGRHGLVIEKGFYRGLLLPQVATENNWTREEFLEYTCIKAGLEKESYRLPEANLYIFFAEVFGEKELGVPSEEEIGKGE